MTCRALMTCSPKTTLLSASVRSEPGGQIGRAGEIQQRLGHGLQLLQRRLSWRSVTAAATLPRREARSCDECAMAMSDGLLYWLSEECWGRVLVQQAEE